MSLPRGELHIYCCWIPAIRHELEQTSSVLNPAERQHVESLRDENARLRALAARIGLRTLLAKYVGQDPKQIEFGYAPHGKPYLTGAAEHEDIEFNLSHAGDAIVLAFARGCEVGADVEFIRPVPDARDIVQRFFSGRERSEFLAVSEDRKDEAFLSAWTRKEALLKATGQGLTGSLKSFSVPFSRAEPKERLTFEHGWQTPGGWSLYHLRPFATHIGAIAVRGLDWQLKYREDHGLFDDPD